jgi:hypothetical protein
VHAYNPSYSRGGERRISVETSSGKKVVGPCLKKKKKKKDKRHGSSDNGRILVY